MFKRYRGFTIAALLIVASPIIFWLHFLFTPLVTNPVGVRYQLFPGTSLKTFAENLHQAGLIRHPSLLVLLGRIRGNTHELKAGIYLIPQGATPRSLLDQVTMGKGLLYKVFTIVPGWTFQQLRQALAHENGMSHPGETLSDAEIMVQVAGEKISPEGQFFPDSYYYVEGTPDLKLLSRAYHRMRFKFQEAWEKRDPQLILKEPQEVLIAASLVEKETHLSSERPVIAGVLINRLQQKMLLQFDPTVIFGLLQKNPSFSGVLSKQDLKTDTPYNTYMHKGLPPTPIAVPSLDAINAVLHPVAHHYLYFVACGDGGHQFSESLSEHNLAVMMARHHDGGFFNYLLIKHYLMQVFSIRLFNLLSPLSPGHQVRVQV